MKFNFLLLLILSTQLLSAQTFTEVAPPSRALGLGNIDPLKGHSG